MKKSIRKSICFVTACTFVLSFLLFGDYIVKASEQPTTNVSMETLLENWESNGYPDYVGGVEGADKQWIIYLTQNEQGYQDSIRNQVSSEYTLVFEPCSYSHQELTAAKNQIIEEYISNVSESVIVRIFITCQEWGGIKEPHLAVAVTTYDAYFEMAAKLEEKYGKMVVVGVYAEVVADTTTVTQATEVANFPETEQKSDLIASPKIKKAKIGRSKLSLQWTKVAGADKYQIKIANNKKMKNAKVVTKKKTSYQYCIKKIPASSYYIRVRAYSRDSQDWSKWSKKIRAK